MHTVTKLVPAPGVLASFDETACAVVDTYHDTWHYLTGDRAWAWETVQVTGSINALDNRDIHYIAEFMDLGLLIADDDTTSVPFSSLDPGPPPPDIRPALPLPAERVLRRAISRAWLDSARMERHPLSCITHKITELHRYDFPFLTTQAATQLYRKTIDITPWWVPLRRYSKRSIAVAAVLAAHRIGGRLDFSFGVRHFDAEPDFWCTSPAGFIGREGKCLAVGVA